MNTAKRWGHAPSLLSHDRLPSSPSSWSLWWHSPPPATATTTSKWTPCQSSCPSPLSQETDHLHRHGNQLEASTVSAEDWPFADSSIRPRGEAPLESRNGDGVEDGGTGAEESEPEEVDPQFYVTVTISSLLILMAIVITAKLCYDRSCSHHPAPLSRGVAPPLSRGLPRSLASEDSRQTLHSTSSSFFTDRERIPVVNL